VTEKELINELSKAFPVEHVKEWIETPNIFFNNKSPKQLIKEKNTNSIEVFLKKLRTGRFTKDKFKK